MRLSIKEWFLFILLAVLCLGLWHKFEYPRFNFIDLSIGKQEAFLKAKDYLNAKGIDAKSYLSAIVFDIDIWPDRYLQKTIGLEAEEEFIRSQDYELFSWKVRFFKEFTKEEYILYISPKSGEVLRFSHLIEDIEERDSFDKEAARQKAQEFLSSTYGFNLKDYDFHEEKTKQYERRVDYTFSWEKKGVYIPWKTQEGGAKLLIFATVSGSEIREFYKNRLDTPEKFRRYIEHQLASGSYLSSFSFLLFIFFLGFAVYIVISRKHTLAIRLCKKWFIYLTIFLAVSNFAYIFNNLQNIIIEYPTSIPFLTYIGIMLVRLVLQTLFLSVVFIMPALAGESLRSEVLPQRQYSSFLHYIKSTFYSRNMSRSIAFGYLLFFIFLGAQAVLFYFGQKYLGVWREWTKFTQLSSAYLPFLSAFIVGARASLSEEAIFRLFGISWGKKYLKSIVAAVIFTSLVWGLGHTEYAVFPTWFRAAEVGILGLIFGLVFIRYGLIPAIVAHYLFDVFWGVAAYIFGRSSFYLALASVLMLAVPFIFMLAAYFINRKDQERQLEIMLNPTEEYNLNILINFIRIKKSEGYNAEEITKELISHNWDSSLVALSVKDVFKGGRD